MSTKSQQHTPTPWKIDRIPAFAETTDILQDGPTPQIVIGQLKLYGDDAERASNCSHIFNAINAHDELVEALEVLVDHAEERYPHFECERGRRDITRARAALARAKGAA